MRASLSFGSVLLLAACAGEVGPQGPPGMNGAAGRDGTMGTMGTMGVAGAPGMDGMDLTTPIPSDVHFSTAVTNNAGNMQTGQWGLRLTFDETVAPGPTTVVCRRLASPPEIDGTEAMGEWAGAESVIAFRELEMKRWNATTSMYEVDPNAAGGVSELRLKCGYDDRHIFFRGVWTETGTTVPNRGIGESRDFKRLKRVAGAWIDGRDSAVPGDIEYNEDRWYMMFPIAGTTDFRTAWTTLGCSLLCHATDNATDGAVGRMRTDDPLDLTDVWHWKAARGGALGYTDDQHFGYATATIGSWNGRYGDSGEPPLLENPRTSGLPTFMRIQGIADRTRPSPIYELDIFDPALPWADGNTIPGVFLAIPAGSRGDIRGVGRFDATTATWTVEQTRLRDTGQGDDYQFRAWAP